MYHCTRWGYFFSQRLLFFHYKNNYKNEVKKIRTVIQPPTSSLRRALNYKMGQGVNVRVKKLLAQIRRKKIQCKKQRLRIAKSTLLCLRANPPRQSNLWKGHELRDFRNMQECFYKKKTTTFLYCKCHKLLIFNSTLKQVTQLLKTNHWCLGITAQMSIEWDSPGEDGEVMAEDFNQPLIPVDIRGYNPKFLLLCEEVLQSLYSSHRKTCVSTLTHLGCRSHFMNWN